MPTVHFEYGGSTCDRTLNCPPWRRIAANVPRQHGANEHADRGTLLHDCMETLGTEDDINYRDLLGTTYNDQVLTEEMLNEIVIPAWENYEKFAEDNNLDLEMFEIEVKDDDDIGGTVDIFAANEDTIFVLDWKFGHNLVSPVENAQGLFYAMCAQSDARTAKLFKGRTKLVIGIIQPAYEEQGDSMIQTWETEISRLNEFAEDFYTAIDTRADTEEPCAGSHCKYCPALAVCPVKTGQARNALMIDPKSAEAAELAQAMAMVAEIEQWTKAVRKQCHEQAELGMKIQGFKLVAKRATRKWTDVAAVEDLVRKARKLKLEDAMVMNLKSPAQLEKTCKAKGVDFDKYDAYIESVSTGTTLAPDSDKRPEIIGAEGLAAALDSISD